MPEDKPSFDEQFMQMIMSLHAAAMQQMGKVMSPITGTIERDLPMAKASIDMLDMMKRKTSGNLSEYEQSLLDRLLYEARMNFVDESNKPETEEETSEAAQDADQSGDDSPESAGSGQEESKDE